MSSGEQAAILLEAAEQDLLGTEDLIRWSDQVILETAGKPPAWLLDLIIVDPVHPKDYLPFLREQACLPLANRLRIQVLLLAYQAGLLSITDALSGLFPVLLESDGSPEDARDEPLTDLLIEWDCLDDLKAIPPALRMKMEAVFRDYLVDAEEVAGVLQGTLEKPN